MPDDDPSSADYTRRIIREQSAENEEIIDYIARDREIKQAQLQAANAQWGS